MPVISIFSGIFCKAEDVIKEVSHSIGFTVVSDDAVVAAAAARSGIGKEKIQRAFSARKLIFNTLTREKENATAYLKLCLGEIISAGRIIVSGHVGQLLPANISHLLRVALMADLQYRLAVAEESAGLTVKQALRRIRTYDETCLAWIEFLHGAQTDCTDPSLYDLFIPMNKSTVEQAGQLIKENALKAVVQPTSASQSTVDDFCLAARVEIALAKKGHIVAVQARDSAVTLHINKHVLMLKRLQKELAFIARHVPGVTTVIVKTGRHFHQTNIYRKHNFNMPPRTLLVNHGQDLAHSLSERLAADHDIPKSTSVENTGKKIP